MNIVDHWTENYCEEENNLFLLLKIYKDRNRKTEQAENTENAEKRKTSFRKE